MKNKIFAGILALSMFLIPTARAEEVDPLIKDYIPRIESGKIKPPQYEIKDENGDGIDDDLGIRRDSPKPKEWIESLKSQKFGGGVNTVLVNKNQKEIKIKKIDKNGKPLKGVEFKLYLDSIIDSNDTEHSTSLTDKDGIATFKVENFYYGGYIKETKTLDKYILRNEEKDIVRFYKDNGVRFIGEKKASDFKVAEAKEGENLNKYLQSLMSEGSNFNDKVDWLVFNDNGVEKLIPKKPLKNRISSNKIRENDLVYGGKTVTIDEKKYKIRLIEGHYEEGSEWNRLILPIIGVNGKESTSYDEYDYANNPYGRYGFYSKKSIEKNMPVLSNYSWWKDFGGLSDYSGNYSKGDYRGSFRWITDSRPYKSYARGSFKTDSGAADLRDGNSSIYSDSFGWLPVLEEVK